MGNAGRYGKYPVYTGTCGVRRSLYGLPAPRRATARRTGPSAARTWRRSSHAPVGLLLFTRRRVAPSGATSGAARARARRGATQARRGRARQPRRTRLRVAQKQNTRYGKTGPGIYRYIPVFYHTGIYPPKYSGRHTPPCCQPPSVEARFFRNV